MYIPNDDTQNFPSVDYNYVIVLYECCYPCNKDMLKFVFEKQWPPEITHFAAKEMHLFIVLPL